MPTQASNESLAFQHKPVLAKEIIESLKNIPKKLLAKGFIVDATIGGGGHSSLILKTFPNIKIIGIDQDQTAREAAKNNLDKFKDRVEIINSNFADFIPSEQIIGLIADLGVSSPQLDIGERGFSFKTDGPLDMRMDQSKGIKAEELISKLKENDLANLIYKYGEEKFSRRIARRIKADLIEKGPYEGTKSLAYAIASCYPRKMRYGRIHPATRTFQALRIVINNELDALDILLKQSPAWLHPNGLLAIISFHSLEDRKVKQSYKNDERLEIITRKPIIANPKEIEENPRSRSAKLRIAIRKE